MKILVLAFAVLTFASAGCGRTSFLDPVEDDDGFLVYSDDGGRVDPSDLVASTPDLPDSSWPDLLRLDDLAIPPPPDLDTTDLLPQQDLAMPDLVMIPNVCGDFNQSCNQLKIGVPLPLSGDKNPDPNATDNGLVRDKNGALTLDSTNLVFDFLWIANTDDWGRGTVSKMNSKQVIEVGRYLTVTCYSNAGGGGQNCDGTNGCCSRDDNTRFQNRLNNSPDGPHQAAQTVLNYPSRTSVDWNGDVWVANRAFGGQSSVTKIASSRADCVERNGVMGLQTSSDVNSDGLIDTDCNRDGILDDIANVKATPCLNRKAQEFYGLDDECILFTTNTNVPNMFGRPLALGRTQLASQAADAWAGTYNDGKFFHIDGTAGTILEQAAGPAGAYGAVVDRSGILWIATLANARLTYLDTAKPAAVITTRPPTLSLGAYGITLDRDENIWMGGYPHGSAIRYTPDRSSFGHLGTGYYTEVINAGAASGATGYGRGVAADSRSVKTHFVWLALDGGYVVRVNASTLPQPNGADFTVDGKNMPAAQVAGTNTIGVGVDTDQNIWGVSNSGSVATRIQVGMTGDFTAPDIQSGSDGTGCPVGKGDRCALNLAGTNTSGNPYTYSDFTGFGLRNFTRSQGTYQYLTASNCGKKTTNWVRVDFVGNAPPKTTTLTVRSRSGKTATPDNTWGAWTKATSVTPELLGNLLGGNAGSYLQVEFGFVSLDGATSPSLTSFDVVFECL